MLMTSFENRKQKKTAKYFDVVFRILMSGKDQIVLNQVNIYISKKSYPTSEKH